VGIDVPDDFSKSVREDMDVELSTFRKVEEARDQTWARSTDERPQRWVRNQSIPPNAADLSSAEQWLVSVVARAGIQVLRYFDDYVGMESAERAEGIL